MCLIPVNSDESWPLFRSGFGRPNSLCNNPMMFISNSELWMV